MIPQRYMGIWILGDSGDIILNFLTITKKGVNLVLCLQNSLISAEFSNSGSILKEFKVISVRFKRRVVTNGVCVKMSGQIYNWKRFWCPRGGHINLSDGGYLSDPDSEWGHLFNPNVVPLESIVETLCLVLLGEPGTGKSAEVSKQWEIIKNQADKTGGRHLKFDLRDYQTDIRLCQEIFENSTFQSWLDGTYRLDLFLDSLDEGLLAINTLATLLSHELGKYPVERLRLCIACRTADWPNILEKDLKKIWDNDTVKIYELAPLRQVDVIEAAKANGLDSMAFLDEIDHKKVVPFAIKPITLNFLLNTYRKNGRFPSTQTELYLDGCQWLCKETNQSRIASQRKGNLTANQRMIAAARIAAVTIFANRSAVWIGVDQGDVPDEDVTVQKLCGGKESVNGDEFEISESAVEETLSTGLFSYRGANRMGWAHQTYAEFLASHYLKQMILKQMMSLIVHPGDTEGKIVPQLHETAAWLSGMNPDVFREIMKADPEVLLRSDVATADVKDRVALVDTLLRLYDEERLLDWDWNIRGHYKKLSHPGLAEQLQPYICDRTKGNIVRRAAINIAEACELQTLQDNLVDIALDSFQPLLIRTEAVCAIGCIGNDATKAKLKPLATGEAGDDPDDELKGYALRAIWPEHITMEELFAVLTPPKQESSFRTYQHRTYQHFLLHDFVQHIQPTDLPSALKWVEKQGVRHDLSHQFVGLMDNIMLQAWEHLESSDVLEVFARAALSRLKHHDAIVGSGNNPPFRNMLSIDNEKRHQVLKTIVPMLSPTEKDLIWLVYSSTPIVLAKDISWMIECLQSAIPEQEQRVWAQLINKAFDGYGYCQLDAVLLACKDNPILAEVFTWLLKTVELNSPEAQKMKANYLESQKWQEQDQSRPLLDPPPAERIIVLLDECESGNLAAWWRLNREMLLEPDSTHYINELEFESDLTVLPGWKAADLITRERIVEAAKRYILKQDPVTQEWLGTNIMYRPAFAGYRALRLLLQEAPGFVYAIPADVWKKWTPIILAYHTSNTTEDEKQKLLIKMAYDYAPDEIIQILLLLIDKENREYDHIPIISKIEICWDDRLANALLVKVKDKKLKPNCMGYLLTALLEHKVNTVEAFAESFVLLPPPSGGEERSKAMVATRVLMAHAEDAGWSVVWPAIQQDTEFGQEVISGVAHGFGHHEDNIGKRLTEEQLADLYLWLVHQYPYAEDPKHKEVCHSVGQREMIADFRDSLLRLLKECGTNQACKAIQRIAYELPDLKWMKWTLLEAQNIARRKTWAPPQPDDILKMARSQKVRLVQSGEQLLDVLIELLKQLEEKLQGETPAAIDLWNETERNVYRPKDENRLSDYVKRYLDENIKQRGIIVNREVEIRHGTGSRPGERIDIRVDAIVRKTSDQVDDSVTAIIEVKGCWNEELDCAMKTQLVDRYLNDNRCQHGLYLVGWFNCNQWDDTDYQKKRAPKIDINEAQKQFDAQAAKLSQQGTRIKAFVINTALR